MELKPNPAEIQIGFLTQIKSRLPSHPALVDAIAEQLNLSNTSFNCKRNQHPDDAGKAIDNGADGVVVSNHGGRQMDGAIGAIDTLDGIANAVADKTTLLFDSGIRRGTGVFKAMALGAKAVLLGRPYAHGLALAGEQGVKEVANLLADIDLTMGLAGCFMERSNERQIALYRNEITKAINYLSRYYHVSTDLCYSRV